MYENVVKAIIINRYFSNDQFLSRSCFLEQA